ncbi:hypothetical protein [Thermotoga sp.]|uniref:hypothetical protein n=1 Tax=Thermotoga sp. TaxID=28240 RepID=UPI0034586F6E
MFVLKQIAKGIDTWSALKNILHAKGDFINDTLFTPLLKTLEKMSFVVQKNYPKSKCSLAFILISIGK